MFSPLLDSALVRILIDAASTRRSVGAGFLVTPQHVITCAHVVNDALGLPQRAVEQPDLPLLFDFPLLAGQPFVQAKILRWFPVQEDSAIGELEDIAVLELLPDSPLPAGAQPAPLVVPDEKEHLFFAWKVRMFGFPAFAPDGTWANGVLQGLTGKGWAEIHHADSGSVAPGFSGTAVWSVRENAVCGMTVSSLSSAASYMIPAAALIQAFPEMDRFSRPANPYRGMEAFREKDARFYFGRERDAATLKEKIDTQSFTAVIGASGSGKSSLVFAGLLPILRQSGDWLICACRPKQQPFHELAACLIPLLYEDELERIKKSRLCAADLRSGELLLSDLLRRIADRNDCRRLLLLVDQFEELYTLNTDRAAARAFVSLLLEAKQAEGFRAVITMRADFLEAALGDAGFAETLNACPPLLLSPIDSQGLRQAVEQPAKLLGIRFEVGLADLIAADVGNEPGSLPLLEFCLTQLWEQQQFRQISHAAYKGSGGVQQALARHAEAVYAGFAATEQESVRLIFLKLVRPGQGTEDTRQVAALADFQEEQRGLIKQLADQRLLVTSGDKTEQQVEVVHEALIRRWQTLRKWVDAEREFLVWRKKLQVLLLQWQESSHDQGALLRGLPLDEAVQWQESHRHLLGKDDKAFIQASEQLREQERQAREAAQREKERQRKKSIGILATGLVITVLLSLFAVFQWRKSEQNATIAVNQQKRAEQNTLEAHYNLAKALEKEALRSLEKADKEGTWAYKRAVLFTAAAFAQKISAAQKSLEPSSVSALFAPAAFHAALVELARLQGHEEPVWSAAFSPDNSRIVSASSDKTVRIWDAATGRQIAVLKGHEGYVLSAAFSPDGSRIVSASLDKTVRIWDAATGRQIAVLKGHEGSVTSAAFSPDNSRIVSASDDKTVRIWDAATGRQIAVLKGHEDDVTSAAFSPDNSRIVSASDDKTVRIWDAATGRQIAVLKGHEDDVTSAAFSPDSSRIVSASDDKTVRIWDAATGRQIAVLQGHESSVTSAAFSPDSSRIVSASWDNTVRIWDAATGRQVAVLKGHEGSVTSAAFSPDNSRIVSASWDKTVRIWDAATGTQVAVLKGHEGDVNSAAFSPDNSRIVSASDDKTVRIWDAATGRQLAVLKGHEDSVRSSAFSPDSSKIVSASMDNTVRIWDAATGTQIAVLKGHEEPVWSAAFSPDNSKIVSASGDKTVRIWDAATGRQIAVLKGHEEPVNSAAFSPDNSKIVSASGDIFSEDHSVRIWDAATGQQVAVLQGHEERVNSAAFSPDNSKIVSASGDIFSEDHSVRIWDAATGQQVAVLQGYEGDVNSATFSPDSSRIVSASSDNTVRIWDAAIGRQVAVLKGHENTVNSAAFSPDSSRIVSASDDKTVRIWDIRSYILFLDHFKPTPLYHTFIQAIQFLWQLDVQGLDIVHKERSPADMERFGSLLAPPPPGQSKFDQVLEWAQKQQGGSGQQAD